MPFSTRTRVHKNMSKLFLKVLHLELNWSGENVRKVIFKKGLNTESRVADNAFSIYVVIFGSARMFLAAWDLSSAAADADVSWRDEPKGAAWDGAESKFWFDAAWEKSAVDACSRVSPRHYQISNEETNKLQQICNRGLKPKKLKTLKSAGWWVSDASVEFSG